MKQVVALGLAVVFLMTNIAPLEAAEVEKTSELISSDASVVSVNPDTRMMTLRAPDGKVFNVKAGENVKNLSQYRPGDRVMVRYHQSTALQMTKAGEQPMAAPQGSAARTEMGRQYPRERIEQTTMSGTIEAIDKNALQVTLKGAQGHVVTVKVNDPRDLENLKVGDRLGITYAEATAVSLERARG